MQHNHALVLLHNFSVCFDTMLLFPFLSRLFLLMDPAQGEISRAMRNRGVEIYMLPEVTVPV